MSLLWHLLKTDLRHARWSLLAWSLAQLLITTLGLSLWYAPELFTERPRFAESAIGLVTFVLLFVTYDFGVRIVQTDNPCVSRAFWRTRPIGPLRLLTAKLLTLLAAALLAALPSASIFLVHRIAENLPLDLSPLLAIWLFQLPFLALAVVFAAFTPSTRHCLFATVLALVAFGIWAGTSAIRAIPNADTGLAASRFYLGTAILLLTAAAAVIHQYRTARLRPALTILALGLTATFTVSLWWHVPLSVHETVAPETESSLTRDIALRNAQLIDATVPRGSGGTHVRLQLDLTPPPPRHLLHIESVHQHWPADGITTAQRLLPFRQLSENYARSALTNRDFTADETLSYTLVLSRDDATTLRSHGTTRAFAAEYTISLTRPEPVFTLPLRSPAHVVATSPDSLAKVVTIDPAKNAIWVSALAPARPQPASRRLGFISVRAPSTYFLVHRPTGTVTSLYAPRSVTALGAKLTLFTVDSATRLGDARWFEDCELVQIAPRPVARFTRRFSSVPSTP